jgi:hypothetical protein
MQQIAVFNFDKEASLERWTVINDGVMGGLSRSTLLINENGQGAFAGRVSLENNGGFASIRLNCGNISVKNTHSLVLKVKGDGKRYQFRIRAKKKDYYSYIQYFETGGEWEYISLPLADFYPTFRGRKLDLPNFSSDGLEEVGFLIGNKRQESFQLLIDSIRLE